MESLLNEVSAILPPPADLADPDELAEMPAQQSEERLLAHAGQLYDPVDRDTLLYYKEAQDGQILEELMLFNEFAVMQQIFKD